MRTQVAPTQSELDWFDGCRPQVGWGVAAFGDIYKSVVKAQQGQNAIVTTGPYALLRHPNYTGEQLLWSANFVAGLLAIAAMKSTKHGLPKALQAVLPAWLLLSSLGLLGIIFVLMQATAGLEKRQREKYGQDEKYRSWFRKTWPGLALRSPRVEVTKRSFLGLRSSRKEILQADTEGSFLRWVVGAFYPTLLDWSKTAFEQEVFSGHTKETRAYPFSPASVVLVNDALQLSLALFAVSLKLGLSSIFKDGSLILKMLPLGLIYAVGELLTLRSVQKGSGPVYVVIANMKLVVAAVMSRLFFGQSRSLPLLHWLETKVTRGGPWHPLCDSPEHLRCVHHLAARESCICITERGWDSYTFLAVFADLSNAVSSALVFRRLSAVAKYVCRASSAVPMYIFYCAVGRALWDAKIFGIVLLLCLQIGIYTAGAENRGIAVPSRPPPPPPPPQPIQESQHEDLPVAEDLHLAEDPQCEDLGQKVPKVEDGQDVAQGILEKQPEDPSETATRISNDRLNTLKQIREAKKEEILQKKRFGADFDDRPLPPKVVCLVGFHTQADPLSLKRKILSLCGYSSEELAQVQPHSPAVAALPNWAQGPGMGKPRVLLLDPPRSVFGVLDAAKCADVIVGVVGPHASLEDGTDEPAFDDLGYKTLTALKAQGLPVVLGAIHGSENTMDTSAKKQAEARKFVTRYFHSELGAETRLFSAGTDEEAPRRFKECALASLTND
eukprot:g11742.t1